MGNLRFSLSTVAHMIRVHDQNRSGAIDFAEFKNLHEFLVSMQNSFNYFDRDRGGTLSPDEIYQAVSHAGFHLDQHAFYSMVRAFDPDRTGQLELAEFIAMTLFLKSCAATFGAYDPQRTGRVQFDFNQFIYACANVR
ncbi:unnamed protein product [Ostreobium quekettii]|uniref:EF-hand domain-containing protein n=1 Tax=Ostreobium quekettii TaxID=121088 RepID=A0A8S1J9I2_9CHLO|nr:unnamed protein product [Ostreobium quekettii]|eukprot:evm.model.scf_381.7 EVM.evm.TU.scf_381.7   scf_381:67196-68665(+)